MSNSNYANRVNMIKANRDRLIAQASAQNGTVSKSVGADCTAMLKGAGMFSFTESVSTALDRAIGEGSANGLFQSVNPKVSKRAVQFVAAIVEKNYLKIDRTTAKAVYAMHLAGTYALNRDAITSLVTNKPCASVNTRGVSSRTLSALFKGDVKSTTVHTQVSRSFGASGFLQQLGATFAPNEHNATITLNREHTLVKQFIALIESGTVGQLESMGE